MWLLIRNSILSQQRMTGLSVSVGASDEALNWKLLGDRRAANGVHAFSRSPTNSSLLSNAIVRENSIESRKTRIFHNKNIGLFQKSLFFTLKGAFSGVFRIKTEKGNPYRPLSGLFFSGCD